MWGLIIKKIYMFLMQILGRVQFFVKRDVIKCLNA